MNLFGKQVETAVFKENGSNEYTVVREPNSFGVVGSVLAWLENYRNVERPVAVEKAKSDLRNAKNLPAYMSASERVDLYAQGDRIDRMIADCSDYQGPCPLSDGT